MSIIKAHVANVQVGVFTLQGLMAENGDFGVAIPQLAERLQFDKRQASRNIKALLGKGFQFAKWKTPLNPKAVNVITLPQLEKVIFELALKGNQSAIEISRALVGLSLQQLFSDAFGIKFESEERQQWLLTRMSTKFDFRVLTDQLKAHGFTEPEEYAKFVFAFQDKLGIKSGTRDFQDTETLVRLQGVQVKLATYMECGLDPWQALAKL